jgi:Xaa-Pro aminopeptidase
LVVELEDGFLGFETLTLVPYERALIETNLLTAEEMAQIDAYHASVLAQVGPRLDGADLDFLKTETSPLV